jgi:C-terminal processing protease CtpA/Prc
MLVFLEGCIAPKSGQVGGDQAGAQDAAKVAGIDFLQEVFIEDYAPQAYKLKTHRLDLEQEVSNLRSLVTRKDASDQRTKEAIINFFGRLRDIHSRPIFQPGPAVWLGIHIKKAGDRYLVAWIDRTTLANKLLSIGDEVRSLDGVPIDKAINDVQWHTQWYSTPAFEQSFAERFLTYRGVAEWPTLPEINSPVMLDVRRKDTGKIDCVTLSWMDDKEHTPSQRCPFLGKTKSGYLPEMGNVIWRAPESGTFRAYVFQNSGRSYGYIRFHSYAFDAVDRIKALRDLESDVEKFNKFKIRGLILDQTGNGGGNFIFGFALLSKLTDHPLRIPLQKYIVKKGELVGFGNLNSIDRDLERFAKIQSDQEAALFLSSHPIFRDDLNFVAKNLATVKRFYRFMKFFVQEGRSNPNWHLTKPYYQFQEWVEPATGPRYEGPILLLTDELNLSAAEYIAATLKDNRRAKVLGITTSGAGGDQRVVSIDTKCPAREEVYLFNRSLDQKTRDGLTAMGLRGFSYTISLGQRVSTDGTPIGPIENIGVTPDREHQLSERDLTSEFSEYRNLIQEELSALP